MLKMYMKIKNQASLLFKEKRGQGMVEYSLLIGLIAIVVIAVLVLLGPAIADKFRQILNALNPPATP